MVINRLQSGYDFKHLAYNTKAHTFDWAPWTFEQWVFYKLPYLQTISQPPFQIRVIISFKFIRDFLLLLHAKHMILGRALITMHPWWNLVSLLIYQSTMMIACWIVLGDHDSLLFNIVENAISINMVISLVNFKITHIRVSRMWHDSRSISIWIVVESLIIYVLAWSLIVILENQINQGWNG
jgi:hypothetical protein